MEPISRKVGASMAKTQQLPAEGQKSAPSKFDRLRADLNQRLTPAGQGPPKVTSINDEQKRVLANDLRRKLETGKSRREISGGDTKQLNSTDPNRQVAAVPDGSALAPLRERLRSIESDFNASAKLLEAPMSVDDPNKLLQMQMEMYKLTENVEVLSRTVSEAASGVKTLLQTQV